MKLIRVGVDLSKQVFQVHGVAWHEQAAWRCKLSRREWPKSLLKAIESGCVLGWKRVVVPTTGLANCSSMALRSN